MKFLRLLLPVMVIGLIASQAIAQRLDDVVATSTGNSYKASILSPDAQKIYLDQRKLLADTRTRLLSQMISELLLETESKAQNSTPQKLLDAQRAKVTEPNAATIQAVYKANASVLGNRPLEEVRSQIVDYLKEESEQKLIDAYMQELRNKHKVVMGKDVNTIGLGPQEVLATVGTQPITMADFYAANRIRINDAEMQIFEELKSQIESAAFSLIINEEARSRNIDTSQLIATEVTDKLREFTEEERAMVEGDLMRRMYAKYNVKVTLPEPNPIVQNVSVDDDPATGNPNAPVTVVMFTDFECPSCARSHPVLKKVLAEFGDKVRFVVRDFPLESIHKDAFQAALAANAARAQGKFTEYIEILYRNQDALDKASLVKYATELGLNAKQFELDFNDAKTAAEIRKDQADGRNYGISGTPAIFVNGIKVQRLSLFGFRAAVERALKK